MKEKKERAARSVKLRPPFAKALKEAVKGGCFDSLFDSEPELKVKYEKAKHDLFSWICVGISDGRLQEKLDSDKPISVRDEMALPDSRRRRIIGTYNSSNLNNMDDEDPSRFIVPFDDEPDEIEE